tara:strand:- start:19573 stop:19764 length:192 start_codon:yes stop_codon:yes gene_type:complete
MPAQAGIFKRTEKTMKQRKIKDNALKAQLRTPMFKMQRQTPKKGKGSYSRKGSNSLRGHRQAA